ncbi:MAG: hypothetical protein EOP84_25795 [Verrucomicrobiaceae bacterium]|nr:MAG: hypothetical protein EOP84_25795 [Verrucomicrobiaceae bacterium]
MTGGAKKMSRTWDFDKVFGMYSTQLEVFETSVRPILKEAMNGFNCTVFAYGPTGTGKTFSMEGDLSDDNLWGMVPRAAQAIFDQFSSADVHLTLKISFLEICELNTVLDPASSHFIP